MIFLIESFGEWKKVEQITVVHMIYERLDAKVEVKIVLAHNKNYYYYYVVSISESDDEHEENLFEGQVKDEFKVSPKTTLNPKVVNVMKSLQQQ